MDNTSSAENSLNSNLSTPSSFSVTSCQSSYDPYRVLNNNNNNSNSNQLNWNINILNKSPDNTNNSSFNMDIWNSNTNPNSLSNDPLYTLNQDQPLKSIPNSNSNSNSNINLNNFKSSFSNVEMDPLSYQMLQLSSKDSLSQLTTNPSLIQNTYFANSNVNYNRQLKDVSIPNSTTTTTTTTNTNKNQLFTNINSSNENHENWNNNNNSVNNNPINNNNNTYNNYLLQQQKQHQNSFSHPYNSNNIQSHNNNNNYVNYKNINNNNNNNNNTNTNKVTNNLQNSNSQSQNLNFNDHIKIHPQQQQSINNINNNNNNINNNHQQSFSSGTTNNNFIYNSNTSQFNNDNNNNISVNTSDFNKAYNNYDSRVLKSNQSTKLNDTDPSEIDSYKTKLQLKDIIISKLELELEKSKDFQNTILKTQNDSNLNFEIPKNHEELYHKLVEKCHLTEVELEDTKTRLESLITAISMNNSNNLNSTFKNGRYDEEEISHKIITKLKMLTEENDELSRMVSYGKSKEKDIEIALLRKQNNDLLEKVAKLESKINDKK